MSMIRILFSERVDLKHSIDMNIDHFINVLF